MNEQPMLSDRGIELFCDGVTDRPVLTVERYAKWYDLYVVYPNGRVATFKDTLDSEGAFISEYHESAYGDHVFNPRFYLFLAKRYGMDFSSGALEVLVGRWLLDHCSVDFSVPNAENPALTRERNSYGH